MPADIDFIVPTLKRPEHIERCLEAIRLQEGCRPRAVVGVRSDDAESHAVIKRFDRDLDVLAVQALGVGVVGSMNSCLEVCTASLIALVDDDVELPPCWATVMQGHLLADPSVVGASGRDMLMDHPEMRRSEPLVTDVGIVHSYGRITGNHHRGGGEPRCVNILRGSNCLYRSDFLKRHGFERSLAGSGAQVNWELALALQSRLEGKKLFFDPSIKVLHHVAPRQDNDTVHRGVFDARGTSDIAHNETVVALKHGRGLNRLMLCMWQLAVGSQTCPGLLRLPQSFKSKQQPFWPRYLATMRGRWMAVRTLMTGQQHAG